MGEQASLEFDLTFPDVLIVVSIEFSPLGSIDHLNGLYH